MLECLDELSSPSDGRQRHRRVPGGLRFLLMRRTSSQSCPTVNRIALRKLRTIFAIQGVASSIGGNLRFVRRSAETQFTFNPMEENMKKKNETQAANNPVHRIRVGAVSCRVFLNKTKEGTEFPSAIISRSYKAGDSFKDSNSYGARHVNELAAVVANLQNWFQTNDSESGN